MSTTCHCSVFLVCPSQSCRCSALPSVLPEDQQQDLGSTQKAADPMGATGIDEIKDMGNPVEDDKNRTI